MVTLPELFGEYVKFEQNSLKCIEVMIFYWQQLSEKNSCLKTRH